MMLDTGQVEALGKVGENIPSPAADSLKNQPTPAEQSADLIGKAVDSITNSLGSNLSAPERSDFKAKLGDALGEIVNGGEAGLMTGLQKLLTLLKSVAGSDKQADNAQPDNGNGTPAPAPSNANPQAQGADMPAGTQGTESPQEADSSGETQTAKLLKILKLLLKTGLISAATLKNLMEAAHIPKAGELVNAAVLENAVEKKLDGPAPSGQEAQRVPLGQLSQLA